MTDRTGDRDALEHLIGAVRDGTLTPAEAADLDWRLQTDPRALAYYLESAALCAALQHDRGTLMAPAGSDAVASSVLPHRRRGSRRRWYAVGAIAAAVLVVVGTAWYAARPPAGAGRVVQAPTAAAVLGRTAGAVWRSQPAVGPDGALPPAARLVLEGGLAEVRFPGGTRVVLEGPAEFVVVGADRGDCRSGRIRARVGPGAGAFAVRTPVCEVVDRGTEFGVAVSDAGGAEVHVFDGRVEVRDRGALPPVELAAGTAVRVMPGGMSQDIAAREAEFAGLDALAHHPAGPPGAARAEWLTHSAKFRVDPRVALYFPFDGPATADGKVRNHAFGDSRELDGTVLGCRRAEGRWPDKGALEFRRPGDGVRVTVPEPLRSFTLAAWVRVDRLDQAYNGLLLGDGWDRGCLHWQLDRAGQLVLGSRDQFKHTTGPVVRPAQFGRWHLFAAARDHRTGVVTQYANGRPVGSARLAADVPVTIGSGMIGGWGRPEANAVHPIRTLVGRIDELVIVREALTADDVRAMFQAGRPD